MKKEELKAKETSTKKKTTKKSTTEKKEVKGKTNKGATKKSTPKEDVIIKEIKKEEKVIEEVKVEKNGDEKLGKKKKIKISDLVLILTLIVVVVLGFFMMKGESNKVTYELPLALSGDAGLQQLTYQEYKEKVDNDEAFVLIIERATCSHCVTYMPIAEEFANNNNVPMYYVDTDTFEPTDWETFEKSNSFLKKNNGNWGTPTTLVLVGSEVLDYVEGTTNAERLKDLYSEYFEMPTE